MNIKLHAKLAAYTKVTNVNQFPEPTDADIGGFVGVGTDKQYTIFKNVSENKIDELFGEQSAVENSSNNKKQINKINAEKHFFIRTKK